MNHERKFDRIDWHQSAELEIDGQAHSAETRNISHGGALLSTDVQVEFDTKLNLAIEIPGVGQPSQIPCVTRWVSSGDEGCELGVQFESLRPIEVWAIGKLIKKG